MKKKPIMLVLLVGSLELGASGESGALEAYLPVSDT